MERKEEFLKIKHLKDLRLFSKSEWSFIEDHQELLEKRFKEGHNRYFKPNQWDFEFDWVDKQVKNVEASKARIAYTKVDFNIDEDEWIYGKEYE